MNKAERGPAVQDSSYSHDRIDRNHIANYLKWLLGKHDFLEEMDLLSDIGLLEGLAIAKSLPFFKRLKECPGEKKSLGKYLSEMQLVHELPTAGQSESPRVRCFFESGSTIAYVIGASAKHIRAKVQNANHDAVDAHFCTNNFFGITAFSGLVTCVEPTIGSFDPHYYGLFSFSDLEPTDDAAMQRECTGFYALTEVIRSSHKPFTTCSNFSFLTGPLVGGRSNALTKRALAQGLMNTNGGRPQYFLIFHLEKIVLLSPANVGTAFKMRDTTAKCQSVFPTVPAQKLETIASRWNQLVAKDNSPQQLPPKLNWHASVLKDGRVPTQIASLARFFRRVRNDNLTSGTLDSTSWNHVAPHVTLVISVPEDLEERAFSFVEHEVETANTLFSNMDQGIQYQYLHPRSLAPSGLESLRAAFKEQRVMLIGAVATDTRGA
jgi:hypothetical protein